MTEYRFTQISEPNVVPSDFITPTTTHRRPSPITNSSPTSSRRLPKSAPRVPASPSPITHSMRFWLSSPESLHHRPFGNSWMLWTAAAMSASWMLRKDTNRRRGGSEFGIGMLIV